MKPNLGRLPRDLTAADIPKPQRLFKYYADPTSTSPWTPTIATKHHALVPLSYVVPKVDLPEPTSAADVATARKREQRSREMDHPYYFETQHLPYPTRMFELAPPIPPVPIDESPLTFVDTPEQLEAMVTELMDAKEIAVDMEYHSRRSYYGFTCLIQISTRERDWVVDAIKLRSSIREGSLGAVMADPSIVKVSTEFLIPTKC